MLLVLGPKRALRHLLGRRLGVYLLAVDDARQVLRPVHLVVVRRSGRLDPLEGNCARQKSSWKRVMLTNFLLAVPGSMPNMNDATE